MSWSFNLYGPKEVVLRELQEAASVIHTAAQSLEETESAPLDSVAVSVSGYASWDEKGLVSVSTTHSHNITRYVPPTQPDPVTVTATPEE